MIRIHEKIPINRKGSAATSIFYSGGDTTPLSRSKDDIKIDDEDIIYDVEAFIQYYDPLIYYVHTHSMYLVPVHKLCIELIVWNRTRAQGLLWAKRIARPLQYRYSRQTSASDRTRLSAAAAMLLGPSCYRYRSWLHHAHGK